MSRLRGPTVRHRQPILSHYARDLFAIEELGSTSGNIAEYGVTTITANTTGMVYTLPTPRKGMVKRVALKYTVKTDDLVFATHSTSAAFFGGSSNNNITVSSSQDVVAIEFYGISTSAWGLIFSGDRGGGSTSIIYLGSTVKSTTDVTA